MATEHLTEADFDTKAGKGIALVDFWAPWCGPCRMLGPVVEQLAKDYAGKAVIAKVNVDDEGGLAQRFGVNAIPAVFILKDGQVVESIVGAKDKSVYAKALDKAAAKA